MFSDSEPSMDEVKQATSTLNKHFSTASHETLSEQTCDVCHDDTLQGPSALPKVNTFARSQIPLQNVLSKSTSPLFFSDSSTQWLPTITTFDFSTQSTSGLPLPETCSQLASTAPLLNMHGQEAQGMPTVNNPVHLSNELLLDAHFLPSERSLVYSKYLPQAVQSERSKVHGSAQCHYNSSTWRHHNMAPSLQENPALAVIVTDQIFADFIQQTKSNTRDDLLFTTDASLYHPLSASTQWSEPPGFYMDHRDAPPPSYRDAILKDAPPGYRCFKPCLRQQPVTQSSCQRQPADRGRELDHCTESDYQALAFLSCLFCWPVGLVAIYYSNMCNLEKSAGNFDQANTYSRMTFNLSLAALIFGIIGYLIICVYQYAHFM